MTSLIPLWRNSSSVLNAKSTPKCNFFTGSQTILVVDVNDGLFTVLINNESQFGPGVFEEFARWLQIEVKGPDDAEFVVLSPRQLVTPGPYCLD